MKRHWVLTLLVSVALTGAVVAWNSIRREREFTRLIAVGDASLHRDQTSVAIEAFSGAVALKPGSMLGYLKRGDTYRRRGDFPAAARDLRQAVALEPDAPRALELLADLHASMGRIDQAVELYRRFIAIDDRSPRVLYKLALAYYRNGRFASAIEPLRQAVGIDDRFGEAHYLLGMCLRERSRHDEATRAFQRAITLAPAFAPARVELANLFAARGRHREHIEQLEALAALEPSRVERLVHVGLAYARLGRVDTAVLTLGRAAERFPDEPLVYSTLGRVWLEAAEQRTDRIALSKAIQALRTVASRETASGEALSLYGQAMFLHGDTSGAQRILADASARLPVDPRVFLYLAAAATRLGHREQMDMARQAYVAVAGAGAGSVDARVAEVLALQRRLRTSGAGSLPGPARRAGRLPGN